MTDLLASLEELVRVPALILILDDLHEIAGSAAERSLEQFVAVAAAAAPGARRVAPAAGDEHPPAAGVRSAAARSRSDDLRFRSWEVEELFISVFREPLSPESAAALTRRTGGWAAGLQLFHLATSGRSRSPIGSGRSTISAAGPSWSAPTWPATCSPSCRRSGGDSCCAPARSAR